MHVGGNLIAEIDPQAFRTFFDGIAASLEFFNVEFIVAFAALGILLFDLVLPLRMSRHLAWVAIAACVIGVVSVRGYHPEEPRLFLGMIAADGFSDFFKRFFLLGTIPVVLLSYLSSQLQGRRMGEYYAVLLASVLGAMLMASGTHFLMLFMALELLSISSYILVGYLRRDRRGAEAALKYIIYGSVAAGIMAFGFSLYFGFTGSADLGSLAAVAWNPESEVWVREDVLRCAALGVTAALLLIFMGMAYKMSTIPMHFWTPDVYEGAPTAVTAFLAVLSKAAGFALALRFLKALDINVTGLAAGEARELWAAVPWTEAVVVISIATMTLGNLAALWQTNLKRLLAYSSIAHAGYMLMGLTILGGAAVDGTAAISYYLLAYLAMNLGAFGAIILIENRTGTVDLDAYRGLGMRAPFLALGLTVCLFSLIGVPPTAGFAGKWQLFMGVLDMADNPTALAGPAWYYILALAAAANTAVSAYYYLKIVKEMYLARGGEEAPISVPRLGTLVVAVMVVLTFYLFLRADQILEVTGNLGFRV